MVKNLIISLFRLLSPKKKILRPFSILDGILSSLLMLFIQVFRLNKLIFRKTFKNFHIRPRIKIEIYKKKRRLKSFGNLIFKIRVKIAKFSY